jgi:hypothetical protein
MEHGSPTFSYPIEFNIEKDAVLDATMTYALTGSAFILELYKYENNVWKHVSDGDFSLVGLEQGEISNFLDTQLLRSVATKWKVVIGKFLIIEFKLYFLIILLKSLLYYHYSFELYLLCF